MADSCVQHLHYRFEDVGGEANTATRFTVLADIEWVKPCLFKGRVESETWSGMKKYYEIVELEIQDLHAQSFRPVPPNPPIQAEEQQVCSRLQCAWLKIYFAILVFKDCRFQAVNACHPC